MISLMCSDYVMLKLYVCSMGMAYGTELMVMKHTKNMARFSTPVEWCPLCSYNIGTSVETGTDRENCPRFGAHIVTTYEDTILQSTEILAVYES